VHVQLAEYIHSEITRNSQSEEVQETRHCLDESAGGFQGTERLACLWKWRKLVEPHGPWDHKDLIKQQWKEAAYKHAAPKGATSEKNDCVYWFHLYPHGGEPDVPGVPVNAGTADARRGDIRVAEEAPVRTGNGDSYALQLSQPLRPGTEFVVLEERGAWLHVQLENNTRGWIRRSMSCCVEPLPLSLRL
jgi:hypothetical protein